MLIAAIGRNDVEGPALQTLERDDRPIGPPGGVDRLERWVGDPDAARTAERRDEDAVVGADVGCVRDPPAIRRPGDVAWLRKACLAVPESDAFGQDRRLGPVRVDDGSG